MLNAYRRSSARAVLSGNAFLHRRLLSITQCRALNIQPDDGTPLMSSDARTGVEPSDQPLFAQKYKQSIYKRRVLLGKQRINYRRIEALGPDLCKGGEEYLVRLSGFMGTQRKLKKLVFAPLTRNGLSIQLVCLQDDHPEAFANFVGPSSISANSAITVIGQLKHKKLTPSPPAPGETAARLKPWEMVEIDVYEVQRLSEFPADILVGEVAKYTPEQRHLQLRFHEDLAARMRFRSFITNKVHHLLKDFHQIDTPILFKSTPEGAREFLVPTRNRGMAYALPQSPQQYKQILMASGVDKYYQMAHCFRDEDLRADRQPEFMQLDMEIAFYAGSGVRKRVEWLVKGLWYSASRYHEEHIKVQPLPQREFPIMKYSDAMSLHGVDKPDLRIKDLISEICIPERLQKMMTHLEDPIINTFKFHLNATPDQVRAFVAEFMNSFPLQSNTDGPPGVFVYDSSRPISGLHAFGHEGAEVVEKHFEKLARLKIDSEIDIVDNEFLAIRQRLRTLERLKTSRDPKWKENGFAKEVTAGLLKMGELAAEIAKLKQKACESDGFDLVNGDLIIMQARARQPFSGGSTAMGRLRTELHKAAVEKGYMTVEPGFQPLWVIDFPMFTPNDGIDPGQGGSAGFSATHHPFTGPKTAEDVDLLFTDPTKAVADHYDLVINGVELGGGSGRIHNAEMQEFVMRDVIKMKPERIEDFRHLLEALRAGCPPHAGLALGWDRLVAMMCGRESIRDVLAFPKDGKGRDAMVNSPRIMTKEQQATYHLKVVDEKVADEKPVDEKPVDEKPVDKEPVDEKPVDEENVDHKADVVRRYSGTPGWTVKSRYWH